MNASLRLKRKIKINSRNKCDGLDLLRMIPDEHVSLVIFDPQYRGILDKMAYGNEGARQKARASLQQMNEAELFSFFREISRILKPSGHLALWADKYGVASGTAIELVDPKLCLVDMAVWEKPRIGMGYRLRRKSEFCLIFQKVPTRAKGIWKDRGMPDVFQATPTAHAHGKPLEWQRRLIEAVTEPGDLVVDPAAGGYSVLDACLLCKRTFLGCDLV